MADLEKLVRASKVITMTRTAPQGEKPVHEDFLYLAGKVSTTCTLILNGEVGVYDKMEEHANRKVVTKGPWSTLAAEVLEVPEGTYVPDFTASIVSETLRFVRLASYEELKAKGKDGKGPSAPLQRRKSHMGRSMYNIHSPGVQASAPAKLMRAHSTGVPESQMPAHTTTGITAGSTTVNPMHSMEIQQTGPATSRDFIYG